MDGRDFQQAMAGFTEAVRLNRDYAEAHYNLGTLFDRQGLIDSAIIEYKEAVRIKPFFGLAGLEYSVVGHNPLEGGLKEVLKKQIGPAKVVIILAGLYPLCMKWINYQMNHSRTLQKPIIGVRPFGSDLIPQEIADAADEIVDWNINNIISSIKRLSAQ